MKGITFILIILLVLSSLARADTEVSGVISTDTIWTIAGSPYVVTGNILVEENVQLTIEPGVIVKFRAHPIEWQAYYIRVDGILDAQGSESNPITFTSEDAKHPWGCIGFTDTSVDWDEATSTGCILSNCIIECGGASQGGIHEFRDAVIRCFSSSPMIRNSIIRYSNFDAIRSEGSGHPKIVSNYIYDNKGRGILILYGNALIQDNVIVNNDQGIYLSSMVGSIEITNNTIISSSPETYGACIRIDVSSETGEILVYKNAITSTNSNSNTISCILNYGEMNLENINFTHNNIENIGGLYSVYLVAYGSADNEPETLDMPNNWWGTTETDKINQMIYDYNDDFNLPLVNYQPIAMEEIPDAGSSIKYSPPQPLPDIKVNGSDGPITVDQSDTLNIAVSLDNNGLTNNADWWLAADTPFGLYFFTFEGWTTEWKPGHQGPLFHLDLYEVLNASLSGFPAGTYALYFGVDTTMDGNVTWENLYYDTVVVNVTE